MTKKDFILLAKMFTDTKPKEGKSSAFAQWELMVSATALQLSLDNYAFNHNRFFTACGFELVKK